jgi:hypothetical protein
MRDGHLYELIHLVGHPIEETDGSVSLTSEMEESQKPSHSQEPQTGSSQLLPTPTVVHMTRNDEEDLEAYLERRRKAKEKANNGNGFGLSLPMALKMLPTPTAQAAKHGVTRDVTANSHGNNLWDIPHLLPTPRTSDTNGPGIRGQGGMDLRTAVSVMTEARLLPTPTNRDHKGRNQRNDDSCLPGAIQQNVIGEITNKP